MRLYLNFAVIGFLSAFAMAEEATVSLKPGAVIQFSFPELPPTLYAQARNDPGPAMLTARTAGLGYSSGARQDLRCRDQHGPGWRPRLDGGGHARPAA